MDFVVIEELRPWDGRYEFDLETRPFTRREWGWIHRFTGYLPLTVDEGWKGGDPGLFAVFAIIALHRAGRITPADAPDLHERMLDGGLLRLETDDVREGDADPPASSNGSSPASGPGMATSSETSPTIPQPAGIPASASSVSSPAGSPT